MPSSKNLFPFLGIGSGGREQIQFCKELILAEDSPQIAMQCITALQCSPGVLTWCQCVVTQPKTRLISLSKVNVFPKCYPLHPIRRRKQERKKGGKMQLENYGAARNFH